MCLVRLAVGDPRTDFSILFNNAVKTIAKASK